VQMEHRNVIRLRTPIPLRHGLPAPFHRFSPVPAVLAKRNTLETTRKHLAWPLARNQPSAPESDHHSARGINRVSTMRGCHRRAATAINTKSLITCVLSEMTHLPRVLEYPVVLIAFQGN